METVTFIVGPDKQRMSCHRALLGYYSRYFDGMLFGTFPEARKDEIELDEDPDHVSAFIKWCYSGHTGDLFKDDAVFDPDLTTEPNEDCTMPAAPLWIFADRIMATSFANAAMSLCRSYCADHYITASAVEHVYANTLSSHKLRTFVRDTVIAEGPLHKKQEKNYDQKVWVILLARGGDLVTDCIMEGFNKDAEDVPEDELPWAQRNEHKYLEVEDQISVAEWIEKNK